MFLLKYFLAMPGEAREAVADGLSKHLFIDWPCGIIKGAVGDVGMDCVSDVDHVSRVELWR